MTTRIVLTGTLEGFERLKGMSLEELSEKLGVKVTAVEKEKEEKLADKIMSNGMTYEEMRNIGPG